MQKGGAAMTDRLALRRAGRAVAPYLLLAPALVLVAVFLYGVVGGVLQGFGIMPFLGETELTFEYWQQVLTRPDLAQSVSFSFYLALASSLLALAGGIVLSAALCAVRQTRLVALVDVQIPLMCAHILVVLFMVSLFSGSGLVPRVLYHLGLAAAPSDFPSIVGDASGWGVLAVYAWKEVPFVAFCTVALMSHVSDRFGEAASTLGASPLRTFFTVTLPLCKGALVKAFLVVFAFAFGAYEVPFLLGPTLPKALPVLAYIEFQNPDIANRSVAMALNGVMALVTTVAAIAYFVVLKREGKGR
ncbi:ABC transporter permease subunit [Eggerthellaceae bacterium zg-893]|nr:ABC transporter permease subunit [Eggerthellaceae bacterium zg-893]